MAGAAAARREKEKTKKYSNLLGRYIFVPVAIETGGPRGNEGLFFIKEIRRRLAEISGEAKSTSFLIQRISMAVQRGNVASILGTLPAGKELEEIFSLQFRCFCVINCFILHLDFIARVTSLKARREAECL